MSRAVRPRISLSVVSHGQGELISNLLGDLQRLAPSDVEILCTLNIPEAEDFLRDFASLPITVLRNALPKGFGANHNQAFRASRGEIFLVVNPDIRLRDAQFLTLADRLGGAAGACAPRVIDSEGREQDNARRTPTLSRLVARRLLHQRQLDYALDQGVKSVDWVAGMFVAFTREAFASVTGFDERYFMYMEDADICRRIRRHGLDILFDPSVTVIHDARRASHRSLRHILWHIESSIRFLTLR